MNELPVGWDICPISDIAEIKLGKMLDKSKNQGLPTAYLRNVNIRWFHFDLRDLQQMLASDSERNELKIKDGDLFICEGGEPGRCSVWRSGNNALIYQKALHRVRVSDGLSPELLMYQIFHEAQSLRLASAFTGTTIKHLTRENLARYEIKIPPAAEQKRIAGKLDALLARVDACRRRLDRVPLLIKRFRQAVLAAATAGDLTPDWREKNRISTDTWKIETGNAVFPYLTSGSRGWAEYYSDTGAKFLRVGNLDHDTIRLDLKEIQFVNPPVGSEGVRTRVQVGDILISITADVGMVALVDEDLGEAYINQHLCGLESKKWTLK